MPISSRIGFPFCWSTSARTAPGSVMPQRVVNQPPPTRLMRMPAATSGTTILTGVFVAVWSLIGDAGETYDLTNIGTLFAFTLVCIGVLVLRYTEPTRPNSNRSAASNLRNANRAIASASRARACPFNTKPLSPSAKALSFGAMPPADRALASAERAMRLADRALASAEHAMPLAERAMPPAERATPSARSDHFELRVPH